MRKRVCARSRRKKRWPPSSSSIERRANEHDTTGSTRVSVAKRQQRLQITHDDEFTPSEFFKEQGERESKECASIHHRTGQVTKKREQEAADTRSTIRISSLSNAIRSHSLISPSPFVCTLHTFTHSSNIITYGLIVVSHCIASLYCFRPYARRGRRPP